MKRRDFIGVFLGGVSALFSGIKPDKTPPQESLEVTVPWDMSQEDIDSMRFFADYHSYPSAAHGSMYETTALEDVERGDLLLIDDEGRITKNKKRGHCTSFYDVVVRDDAKKGDLCTVILMMK